MDYFIRFNDYRDFEDEVTIKVKVADEEYQDMVINRSYRCYPDGDRGDPMFDQLSSITGFPSKSIDVVAIYFGPHNAPSQIYNVQKNEDADICDIFKQRYLDRFNDGDCFAISTQLRFGMNDFYVLISLYNRNMFADNDCTQRYCHYVSNRAFLDAQVAIVTNTELRMQLKSKVNELPPVVPETDVQALEQFYLQKSRIYLELGIKQFMCTQPCRSNYGTLAPEQHRLTYPNYIRTRG